MATAGGIEASRPQTLTAGTPLQKVASVPPRRIALGFAVIAATTAGVVCLNGISYQARKGRAT